MLGNKTIGFIGAGNMAETLFSGLIGSQQSEPDRIICADVRQSHLDELRKRYGIRTETDNPTVVKQADILIYAVKPQNVAEVFKETADALDASKVVISIAAGVPMAAIDAIVNKALRLIRVMPNVCVSVNEGAAAMAAGSHAEKDDIEMARAILQSVGRCILLKDERLLDAVTGVSGSGPAYIFLIMDALADGGVKMGLTRQDALELAAQTVLGAAKMLLDTGMHPGQLKDMVTSPGGTTIAGLHALEAGGLRPTLINGVEAATLRATELGELIVRQFKEV